MCDGELARVAKRQLAITYIELRRTCHQFDEDVAVSSSDGDVFAEGDLSQTLDQRVPAFGRLLVGENVRVHERPVSWYTTLKTRRVGDSSA
jgi:hypothetical protein